MNRLISNGPFPFWGCSRKDELTTLSVKKSREHGPKDVPEFRLTEQRALKDKKARPQPVWKIAYAGAVGGKTMTGLPAIERVREKVPGLKLWPFELPLARLTGTVWKARASSSPRSIRASIRRRPEAAESRDEAQVRAVAEGLAELDVNGKLGGLFAGGTGISDSQKASVMGEEGWILGI